MGGLQNTSKMALTLKQLIIYNTIDGIQYDTIVERQDETLGLDAVMESVFKFCSHYSWSDHKQVTLILWVSTLVQ